MTSVDNGPPANNRTYPDYSDFDDVPSLGVPDWWRRIVVASLSMLIIVGTPGNIASILVFSRRQMRVVPAYTLLLALAVTDTVMVTWIFGEYCSMLLRTTSHLFSRSQFYCAFLHTAIGSIADITSLLIVIVAVMHCACVCCCCHMRQTCVSCCRLPRTVIWIVAVVVLGVAANVHMGLCSFVLAGYCSSRCSATHDVFILKKMAVEIAIIVLTIFFSCRLVRNCRACLPQSYQTLYNDNAPDDDDPSVAANSSSSRDDPASKLTVTIFTLLVVFLITNVPISVMSFVHFRYVAFYDMAVVLWCSNYSIKFFVYVATAPDFRRNLREMLTSLRLLPASVSSAMRLRETLVMDDTSTSAM